MPEPLTDEQFFGATATTQPLSDAEFFGATDSTANTPEMAQVPFQVIGAEPIRRPLRKPSNTAYEAALAKLPPEQQYRVAKAAGQPYSPGVSDAEMAAMTAVNAVPGMVQEVARLTAAIAAKTYGPAERSNLEAVVKDQSEPAWKRGLADAWLKITGPTVQEELSGVPAQSAGGAALRGGVNVASGVLPYLIGPEAVAGKLAVKGLQGVVRAAGGRGLGRGLASRALGEAAFFSGSKIPTAATEALEKDEIIKPIVDVLGEGPRFAKHLAEAPIEMTRAVRRGMDSLSRSDPEGFRKSIQDTVEASGPWAVILGLHALGQQSGPRLRKLTPEAKELLLSPEGAAALRESNPELADAIAAKDQPSRTDVGTLGVKLTGPERAQLSALLRETPSETTTTEYVRATHDGTGAEDSYYAVEKDSSGNVVSSKRVKWTDVPRDSQGEMILTPSETTARAEPSPAVTEPARQETVNEETQKGPQVQSQEGLLAAERQQTEGGTSSPPSSFQSAKHPWETTRSQFVERNTNLVGDEFMGVKEKPKRSSAEIEKDLVAVKAERRPGAKEYFTKREKFNRTKQGSYVIDRDIEQWAEDRTNRERQLQSDLSQSKAYEHAVAKLPDRHRFWVSEALREGKPVPAEVLKDYPDLKPQEIPNEEVQTVQDRQAAPADQGTVETRPEVKVQDEAAKPPAGEGVQLQGVGEPEFIGLAKEENAALRERLSLPDLPEPKKKAMVESYQRAKAEKLDESALETAKRVIEEPWSLTGEEEAGIHLRTVQLNKDLSESRSKIAELKGAGNDGAVQIEQARADAILDQIDTLSRAYDASGTIKGREFQARKARLDSETFELGPVLQRAREAKKAKLTPEEQAKYEDMVTRLSEKDKALSDMQTRLDEANTAKEKAVAEAMVKREARKARITAKTAEYKQRLYAERADLKKQLAAMGYRTNAIVGPSPDALYVIGKLAMNYAAEGAANVSEVVQKVLADLPDLSERDVWAAMNAKNPKAQKRAKSEVEKRVSHIKSVAKLLVEIDNATKGEFKEAGKRPETPADIAGLRKKLTALRDEAYASVADGKRLEKAVRKINELQDMIHQGWRPLRKAKKPVPPDLAELRGKIAELGRELDLRDDITSLQHQLDTGDFVVKTRPEKVIPPELRKLMIERDRLKKEIRSEIDRQQPMTLRRGFAEASNLLRTLKATADMSATLRQGLVLAASRPVTASKAFAKSLKPTFSHAKAEEVDFGIRNSPTFYKADEAGLRISDLDGPRTAREEYFMSNAIEHIPILRNVARASERHMVTYLNLLRKSAFDEFLEKNPNATNVELKAWADFVNAASGYGSMGKATELASVFMFAPRFAASRFQTPWKFFKYIKEPRVRKAIAKDLAAFGALEMTALTLASFAGAQVGLDPRDSDFGKIQIGNTRYDLWAGFQQPARLLARLAIKASDDAGITGKALTTQDKDLNGWEMFGRFAAYKMAPITTIPMELITGKTAIGKPVGRGESLLRAVEPMLMDDIIEAYKDSGIGGAARVAPATFFGAGASTYEEGQTGTRRELRVMKHSGEFKEAEEKRAAWNKAHPDKKITDEIATRAAQLARPKPLKKSSQAQWEKERDFAAQWFQSSDISQSDARKAYSRTIAGMKDKAYNDRRSAFDAAWRKRVGTKSP